MLKRVPILLLLFAFGCADGLSRFEPSETWIEDDGTVIPSRHVSGYFFVEGEVNGAGPFVFMIDTGASALSITPEAAHRAGLVEQNVPVESSDAGGRSRELDTARIESLDLGPARLRGFDAVVGTVLDGTVAGEPVDGIIGAAVFRGGVLVLDYGSGLVHLELPNDSSPARGDPLIIGQKGGLYVKAKLGDRTVEFLLDTGASYGFALDRSQSARAAMLTAPRPAAAVRANTGTYIVSMARLDEPLVLGGHVIERPIASFDAPRNRLGIELLEHFVMTIDQPRRRVDFVPVDPARSITFEAVRGTGLLVRGTRGRAHAWIVLPGSPAEAAGIREGDRIYRFNGHEADELTTAHLRAALRSDEIEVVFDRDGVRLSRRIACVELVP